MLKSQNSRMIVVFVGMGVVFLIALGHGVITSGQQTLVEYLISVIGALISLAVVVAAVIWAVRGD